MSKFQWKSYIAGFVEEFPDHQGDLPWELTERIREIIKQKLKTLPKAFKITDETAIHKSAVIESGVIMKGPMIIGPNCFIASGCYLRDGVYMVGNNSLGPGCELKSAILFPSTNLAHFNFVGDSLIGSHVNFEAGSVIANHYNERKDKTINVALKNELINTGVEKFGSLVGDDCKIGANAVLSPGTVLAPATVVARLQLIDQTGS